MEVITKNCSTCNNLRAIKVGMDTTGYYCLKDSDFHTFKNSDYEEIPPNSTEYAHGMRLSKIKLEDVNCFLYACKSSLVIKRRS